MTLYALTEALNSCTGVGLVLLPDTVQRRCRGAEPLQTRADRVATLQTPVRITQQLFFFCLSKNRGGSLVVTIKPHCAFAFFNRKKYRLDRKRVMERKREKEWTNSHISLQNNPEVVFYLPVFLWQKETSLHGDKSNIPHFHFFRFRPFPLLLSLPLSCSHSPHPSEFINYFCTWNYYLHLHDQWITRKEKIGTSLAAYFLGSHITLRLEAVS
jgi:hypothetical protein